MVLDSWIFETGDGGKPKLSAHDYDQFRDAPLYPTEQVFTHFDADDVQGIRQILKSSNTKGYAIEKVQRAEGGEAIEVVYHNDEKDPGRHGPTVLAGTDVRRVREELHRFLPENWRVHRKDNDTRNNRDCLVPSGKSVQRLMIRRVAAQRFRYEDDSEFEYREALGELPDGLPDDAETWDDLYDTPPSGYENEADVFVYESSTGTKHLLQGRIRPGVSEGFRGKPVYEPASCYCGHSLNPQTLTDKDGIRHYADYLTDLSTDDADLYSPDIVFGEDLCGACWRSYAETATDKDGNVIDTHAPARSHDYYMIKQWRENP